MAEVGLLITLKDLASDGLKKMGGTAKKSLSSVRSLANKAKGAFSIFGKAMTGINQAMEIGRKLWGAMRVVVADNVREALAFRKAGDPVLKWFENMKRESRLLRAAIGDALIPVIQTLAESLGLVGDGARQWVIENRKLIATGVLDWTIKVARALTSGVARAAEVVVKIWNGWKMVIGVVQLGIGKFFSFFSKGIARVLGTVREVASALGQDGMVASIDSALASVESFGDAMGDFGEAGLDSAFKANTALEEQEAIIDGLATKIDNKLVQAHVDGQRRIATSIAGTNRTLEEQAKIAADTAARIDEMSARRLAEIERRSQFELELAKATEARKQELIDQTTESVTAGADIATEAIAAASSAQGDAAGAAAKVAANAAIDSAIAKITAFAAEGAAAAFSSLAGIPIVGPALGAAASATVGAAIAALGSGLKGLVSGFAAGGFVGGGIPGRDSVFAGLTPGEFVMTAGAVEGTRKMFSQLLGAQAGATAGSLVAGRPQQQAGGQPIIINQKTELRTWAPQVNEEMRMARQLETRSRKRLQKQGMLIHQGAAV